MLSLPKHPAVRRIAKNSVIASLRSNLVETKRQTIAPDKSFICARLYKSFAFETLNATFPFPQVFSLSPFPPCKGTHGDRVAGDNTRSRHNLRQFSHCATSLCAPATQQHGAVACTLRQVRRSIRSPPCGSNGEDRRHSHR